MEPVPVGEIDRPRRVGGASCGSRTTSRRLALEWAQIGMAMTRLFLAQIGARGHRHAPHSFIYCKNSHF